MICDWISWMVKFFSWKGIQGCCTFSLIWSKSYSQIKKDDLESALAITKASFPGNIEVWLKDLASLLNIKLEQCPEPDPVMKNKPKGKPSSINACMSLLNKVDIFIKSSNSKINFSLSPFPSLSFFFFFKVLAHNFAYTQIFLCVIWPTNARMWLNLWLGRHRPRPWSTCCITVLQLCCQKWTKVFNPTGFFLIFRQYLNWKWTFLISNKFAYVFYGKSWRSSFVSKFRKTQSTDNWNSCP